MDNIRSGSNNKKKIKWTNVCECGYVKHLLKQPNDQTFKLRANKLSSTHALTNAYWEINSTFFTFYDDEEKNVGGHITKWCVRTCFVPVYNLGMVCVCVCFAIMTGLCGTPQGCVLWSIKSLHTICLMSCHHLCWKAPMAHWCEYILILGVKRPTKLGTNASCWLVGGSVYREAEVEKNSLHIHSHVW